MFRKLFCTTLFALMFALSSLAQAQDAGHRAAVQELFDLMNMEAVLKDSIDQSLDIQIQAEPGLAPFRDTMKAFFDKYMSYESLRAPLMQVYTDAFTEAELKEITAFYRTPVGQKTLEKMPAMYQKGAEIGMQRVQENMGELQQMIAARAAELEAENQ